MNELRSRHGCARITRKNRDYIAVFGGTTTTTIELYDLVSNPSKWETISGISFGLTPLGYIIGTLVKAFDVNFCNAMFMDGSGKVRACSGNYTWTDYQIGNFSLEAGNAAVVDASFFGGYKIF
jgi:hypothetical protein